MNRAAIREALTSWIFIVLAVITAAMLLTDVLVTHQPPAVLALNAFTYLAGLSMVAAAGYHRARAGATR